MDNEEELKVWCGNLSSQMDEELLFELFLQAGPVKNVKIPLDNKTGKNQTYGFVTFKHKVSVPYAIDLLHDTELFEKRIIVRCKGGSNNAHNQRGPAGPMQPLVPFQFFSNDMHVMPMPLNGFNELQFGNGPMFGNNPMPFGANAQVPSLLALGFANDNLQSKSRHRRGHHRDMDVPYQDNRRRNEGSRHHNGNDRDRDRGRKFKRF